MNFRSPWPVNTDVFFPSLLEVVIFFSVILSHGNWKASLDHQWFISSLNFVLKTNSSVRAILILYTQERLMINRRNIKPKRQRVVTWTLETIFINLYSRERMNLQDLDSTSLDLPTIVKKVILCYLIFFDFENRKFKNIVQIWMIRILYKNVSDFVRNVYMKISFFLLVVDYFIRWIHSFRNNFNLLTIFV